MLASEELFFPFTRKWSGTSKQLPNKDMLLKAIDDMVNTPQIIKDVFSAIIKLFSKILSIFLLWGTEDSDLTIEEEVC